MTSSFLLLWYSLLLLLLLLQLQLPNAQRAVFTIKALSQPANCFGGQVCHNQPSVGVYGADGLLALTFVGTAYVNMKSSPTGTEPLWLGECDYTGKCGQLVFGSIASVPFVGGIATFKVFLEISLLLTKHSPRILSGSP